MICPNCQNEQSVAENSYGALYTCKSCQAVYFINFEGQPEFSSEDQPVDLPYEVSDGVHQDDRPELMQTAEPHVQFNQSQFNQNEFSAEPSLLENLNSNLNNFSDVAKDISDYGNTETQIAHLNYDLKITGIDSVETMRLLKEVIEDSRFGWDTNEIMRSIKRGEIYFEKLNPVKAYILAKRLHFLDVEKTWKQNAVG